MEYRTTPSAVFDALAQAAKGLAHPKRLELLDLLAQGERSVDALAQATDLQVTTASAQLQALHRAGLVDRRKEGVRVLYRLSGDEVAHVLTALRSVAERRIASLELTRRTLLSDELPVVDLQAETLVEGARAGRLVVLDVRSADEYSQGHIPGARSIPVEELEARLQELPRDSEIVAYCRGSYCVMSHDAVKLLRENGLDASVLSEGVLEWRAAGLDLEAA